ncbi:MAG: (d)CMP kinase [Holophagaceae bacterium]|nr:(d)CMP kinase [Holophagaceae bacterium]
MTKLEIIAIDGPSGAGKSSAAKKIAEALSWDYLDTGAMYRATALALKRAGAGLDDEAALFQVLRSMHLEQLGTRIFLNDEDVSEAIRSHEITQFVTPVSADGRVREVLVEQQRHIGQRGGFVVDGRDIGTVVFPNAALKIYLTASVEARAQRRFLEQQAKGIAMALEAVAADIQRRDHADSTRAVAPLRRAEDAVELDSSGLTLEEVVAKIVEMWGGAMKSQAPSPKS